MKFIFICPETHRDFKSKQFVIIENHGVKIDHAGNRILDATVELTLPCPHCGQKHLFHASEITCPLTPNL